MYNGQFSVYNNTMGKKRKTKKRGNPVAKDLRTPKYRMRVATSKKVYDRKRVYAYYIEEV